VPDVVNEQLRVTVADVVVAVRVAMEVVREQLVPPF